MKKIISLLLICVMLMGVLSVQAQNISVYVNGNKLQFDVQPQLINDRTMVPMRAIFEALGANVSWDEEAQTVTGRKEDTVINISIGSKTLFKNGIPVALDVAPALIDGRTLVPVRAIAESFDCLVTWVEETQSVQISTHQSAAPVQSALTASEISDLVAPSVFYIEVYDEDGDATASGSGFFVTEDGVAITNYHVIEDTSSAIITTISGLRFNVEDVVAFDASLDVAIIRISKTSLDNVSVSSFPCVEMGNSDTIKAGQTVFALGSPEGLQNTISDGIISNVKQVIGSDTFIQTTAPISHGSSGGALVNTSAQVIGITSAGILEGENLGFAIPINVLKQFDLTAQGLSYFEFSIKDNKFTIDIPSEIIELNVGETAEVMVYTEGKGDWPVYWKTEHSYTVSCQWGERQYGGATGYPLYITGTQPGYAVITVYSDADFVGQNIQVYVKQQSAAFSTYPGVSSNIPTYTYVTGIEPTYIDTEGSNYLYIYPCHDASYARKYTDYLTAHGFVFSGESYENNCMLYTYTAPDGNTVGIALPYAYNEVWITVPF